MAKFKVGDRVQVLSEVRGIKDELLGAKGTVKAQAGDTAQGTWTLGDPPTPLGPWSPMYEVQFDDTEGIELVEESWITSA